jgi:hypothetical protein
MTGSFLWLGYVFLGAELLSRELTAMQFIFTAFVAMDQYGMFNLLAQRPNGDK